MCIESKKLSDADYFLSRAVFIHINYGNCDGVLTYLGEFPSDVADDVYELIFECKKCKGKVVLV